MARARSILLTALVGLGALAGCFGSDAPGAEGEGSGAGVAWPRCEHPWPCGDGSEWPPGLVGPFEVLPAEPLRLESHDGTVLAGHVWRPDLPEGVRAPVVVFSSPYFGQARDVAAGDPDDDPSTSYAPRMEGFLGAFPKNGFALLLVSVRGTGESGGCFGWGGRDEQLDHALLVDWAASQPWSNGRVGFWGISYMGTTPWEAAILAPEGLKAVWAGGIITDWYLNGYTPQGLSGNGYAEFSLTRFVGLGLAPPTDVPIQRYPEWAPRAPERVCPGTPDAFLRHAGTTYADDRKAAWFEERRYVDRFADVTAAIHVPHGLQDNGAHRFQEDVIWHALPNAPKWFLLGQWGHTIDFDDQLRRYPHGADDWDLTLAWFAFWLKGVGEPPRVGTVDYQATGGAWREAAAWPPPEARDETLFLGEGVLAAEPQEGAWSFLAAPAGGGTRLVAAQPARDERGCAPEADAAGTHLVFVSEPAAGPVLVAGNPYALLSLASDRPGGGFRVELVSFPGGSPCEDPSQVQVVARGGVDLRFHDGSLAGRDFPTGSVVPVRVDLWNAAHDVPPGHRLALVLQPAHEETQPWSPTLTLHGGSHLVLPVVEGTLGGSEPPSPPPPRPFAPAQG